MKLRTALLAASMFAAPAAAFAQPVTGPYVSLGVGANYLDKQNISSSTTVGVIGQIKSDTDVMGLGSLGYGLGNGLRIEVQGDYRQNTLKSLGGQPIDGHIRQYGGFVNVLYDYDLSAMGISTITPYFGVGGGYEETSFENANYGVPGSGVSGKLDSSRGSFAVQGIFGVAYNVPGVPGLALTAEGRVMAIPEQAIYHGPFEGGTTATYKAEGPLNYSGLLGLRYAFFTAAPPPPPPPAVAPAVAPPVTPSRTYLVFFDWDRADLTSRARAIISEAAQAATHVATTTIEVNGYTDLSGTAAYNQKLSVRRAESVEAELVRDGVAKGEIGIHGYGESNPLVPTAKGVREPQNRRVEIILH